MLNLSSSPRVFLLKQFLSNEECDHLVRAAMPHMAASTVIGADGKSVPSTVRTSSGTFLPWAYDRIVYRVESRVAEVTGIPTENQEDLQILRYGVGQEYQPHHDWFNDEVNLRPENGGQRLATVLMYLTDVAEGGETVFPIVDAKQRVAGDGWSECAKRGLSVKAAKGDALMFYSLQEDGLTPDPLSMHGSCPTIRGEKWSATISMLLSCSSDQTIRSWNIETGDSLESFQGPGGQKKSHDCPVFGIVTVPEQNKAVSSAINFIGKSSICVWELNSGHCEKTLKGLPANCLAASSNGVVVSAGSVGYGKSVLQIWDIEEGTALMDLEESMFVSALSVAQTGDFLCTGGHSSTIHVWDIASRSIKARIKDVSTAMAGFHSMSIHSEGSQLVSGSFEGDVKLWDLKTGQCSLTLKGHAVPGGRRDGYTLYAVAHSPDGRHIYSAGRDRTVHIWDATSGDCVQVLTGHTDIIFSMATLKEEIITGSGGDDGSVRIWDIRAGGKCRAVLEGHTGAVFGLAVAS